MDSRTMTFIERFKNAQKILKAKSLQDIVSIKVRENVHSSEYHECISYIEHDLMLKVVCIQKELGRQAWLVTDSMENNVILIEHETGLELLYIAGSIASLVSLILSCWQFNRNRFGDRWHNRPKDIEIRKFDSKNVLIEKPVINIINYFQEESKDLLKKLEEENKKLREENKRLKGKTKKVNKNK